MGRSPSQPLSVTGIGVASALGIGHEAFESALFTGASALAPVTAFDTSDCRAHVAARPAEFDPTKFVAASRLRRIDRTGQLAIMSSGLALEHAALLPEAGAGWDDVGVALGSYTTGLHSLIDYLDKLNALGPIGASALDFSNTVGNAAASLCGLEFGLRGPNVTLSQREASGLGAIAYATTLVRSGQCRAVVTGGIDDFERLFFAVHDRFRVLAHDDGHGEASRPFDVNRNGFVLGSGGYVITLEHPASAARRGATVHGEVIGVGSSSARTRPSDWPTEIGPLVRAMRGAVEQAGCKPTDVAAVFASANSTQTLDRLEAEAIASVFGPIRVPVVAVKGALGECGATSAASLIAALASLRRGALPPTHGLVTRDPACPVDAAASARPLAPGRGRVALVNAFATGGTNYSIAVRGPINIQG